MAGISDDKQRFMGFAITAQQDGLAIQMCLSRLYRALLTNNDAELKDAVALIAKHAADLTSKAITFKALAESIRNPK